MSLDKSKAVFIILYALGLSLLIGLSVWQYQRGNEKQRINTLRAKQGMMTISAAPESWTAHNYRTRQLKGKWREDRSLLLENRMYRGQPGFEVLTPFILTGDSATILVNRGWISDLVQAETELANTEVSIIGVAYLPESGLELGESILPEVMASQAWPKKSLYIDMPAYASILGMPIQDAILVLEDTDPAAFVRTWKAVVMPPAKHFGYAIQWLGLALALAVYGFIWFKRN